MISAYPLVATLLTRPLSHNSLTRVWRILALSLVLVAPSQAQSPQALTPFSITYQVSHQGVDAVLGVVETAVRILLQDAQDGSS